VNRKRHLPPSPLARRRLVSFDLTDPEERHTAAGYLRDRLDRLARDKKKFPDEFDRLIATAEAWCREVLAEAGLRPDELVPDDLYPEKIWYASQINSRVAEIRDLREKEPDLVLGLALLLGELIGEAQAHLTQGENAARGLKSVLSAREGHEQVHGTEDMKQARWRAQVSAFERYQAEGHGITSAEALAAEELGVSPRTIHEARKRTRVR
jgi:hypothetical protein